MDAQVDGQEEGVSDLVTLGKFLVTWISVGAMVFGGIVPFIPQYRKIRRHRDAEGFSTYVCLVLLVANVLRILFWFGKRYELPLLLQSGIMIATMLAMMHICTAVKLDQVTVSRRFKDFDYQHFWRWTHFADYCYFLVAFSVAGSLVTFLFLGFSLYVELLGFASLLLEACLGLPQLWRNYSNKSTEGMRCQILLMFLIVFGGCCVYSAFVH
ncbi:Solute carrier family 66 member 2, partial [Geodia barretti]